MKFLEKKELQRSVQVLLLAAVVLFAARASLPELFGIAAERLGHVMWRLVGSDVAERRIVVVDIDESSLAKLGPWPWPKERMAELSQRLSDERAGAQIYDVVFSSPQSPGDESFFDNVRRHNGAVGELFDFEPGRELAVGVLGSALDTAACPPADRAAGNVSVPAFRAATGFIGNASTKPLPAGHINPLLDADGMVRHQAAVICHQARAYPSLAIAALARSVLKPDAAWAVDIAKGDGWLDAPWRLSFRGVDYFSLPLDAAGNYRVPYWLNPQAVTSISAADLLERRVPAELLDGAIVLVGGTAFGISDAVATPHGNSVAGVSVHTQIISALLDGRIPVEPRGAQVIQLILAIGGAGALLLAALSNRKALWLPVVGLLFVLAVLLLQWGLLKHYSLWVNMLEPAAFALLASAFLASYGFATSKAQRDRLFNHLASYLPPAVAAELSRKDPVDTVDAARENAAVLCIDIRNFSAFCEKATPEEIARFLHDFYRASEEIISGFDGLVESRQGDRILAAWKRDADLGKALQAALAIARDCDRWLPDLEGRGLEPMAVGQGLEYGAVLVGSIGSRHSRSHALLGSTVTVAIRLQELTPDLSEPILIGPEFAKKVSQTGLVNCGAFLLEGFSEQRQIYRPGQLSVGNRNENENTN